MNPEILHITILFICILVGLIAIYLFLIMPRIIKKPKRDHLMGYYYAHRGLFDNNSDAPENSLKAFKNAVTHNYGIELDVQLSKDKKLVVFHDEKLKRMTGKPGKVWEYTLEELQSFKLLESDETIPTFESVLEAVDGKVPLIIEYKLDVPSTEVCELANKVLENYKGDYCIESFHPYALMWYKKHRPDVVRGQLSEEFWQTPKYKTHYPLYILSLLLTNVATRPDFIAYNCEHAFNLSRRLCKLFGALSVAWTVKNQETYNRIKDQFDLFIFDSFLLKN